MSTGAIDNLSKTLLSHYVFDNGKWVKRPASSYPAVSLHAGTLDADYKHFGFDNPCITNIPITVIVDSGAQCCVWSWRECKAAGFKHEHLIPVRQKLNAVSKNNIRIYAAIILRMSGTAGAANTEQCGVIVYISPDVAGFIYPTMG